MSEGGAAKLDIPAEGSSNVRSAKEGRRLLGDLRAVTDKPARYVVNTHHHLDHTLGNCVFEDLGAVIVAHSGTTREIEGVGEKLLQIAKGYGLTDADLEGTRVVNPGLSFQDRLQIDLGGVTVELLYAAPSHTGGSILVYLPARKVLFTGDVLFTDFHPYMADARPDRRSDRQGESQGRPVLRGLRGRDHEARPLQPEGQGPDRHR